MTEKELIEKWKQQLLNGEITQDDFDYNMKSLQDLKDLGDIGKKK